MKRTATHQARTPSNGHACRLIGTPHHRLTVRLLVAGVIVGLSGCAPQWKEEQNGVTKVFLSFEPPDDRRYVRITRRGARKDWAQCLRKLVDQRYPEAEQVVLVMDNLNPHGPASRYQAFEPAEARRVAQRLEIHYTPKHGSWLNMAEIELSVLARQCLDQRMVDIETLRVHATVWEADRNARQAKVDWRFTTNDARIKPSRLYPSIGA